MRELVLNHASLDCDIDDIRSAGAMLVAMAQGVSRVVALEYAVAELRAIESLSTVLVGGVKVWDALVGMLRARQNVEEVVFLMGIAHKTPLLDGVAQTICGKFYSSSCEEIPKSDGLVYCAVADGIAVSVASSESWRSDTLDIRLTVLSDDALLESRVERIDNVSTAESGAAVGERMRQRNIAEVTSRDFWEHRAALFPNLRFGSDVEDQVTRIDEGSFRLVISRLFELDATAREWVESRTPSPSYRSYVSPESESTMQNPALVQARTFRGPRGDARIYEWHARFGSGGRIHFIPDSCTYFLEVGYIGPHLPL